MHSIIDVILLIASLAIGYCIWSALIEPYLAKRKYLREQYRNTYNEPH